MEARFPSGEAEPWDTVGLQVGDPEAQVEAALVALDATEESVEEASRLGASLMVVHHPIWLGGLRAVRRDMAEGKLIWLTVKRGINVACAHTNLDRATGGPNDLIAQALRMKDVESVASGLGRIGNLSESRGLRDVWEMLPCRGLAGRIVGDLGRRVRRVAICCGSGTSALEEVAQKGADLLITGDVKYHDARRAQALGVALIDPGHFGMERLMVPWLAKELRDASAERGWGIAIFEYQREEDPFCLVQGARVVKDRECR